MSEGLMNIFVAAYTYYMFDTFLLSNNCMIINIAWVYGFNDYLLIICDLKINAINISVFLISVNM